MVENQFLHLLFCKDSAKFRLSEGNEKIFLFLSVRKLIKSNEKPYKLPKKVTHQQHVLFKTHDKIQQKFSMKWGFLQLTSIPWHAGVSHRSQITVSLEVGRL